MTDNTTTPDVHLYLLLDRSGSMASMVDDVIGGVNHFLADQRTDGNDALVTLVQFDGQDPQEVVADAVPIAEIVDLDATTFVPRGATPLLDATGRLLKRAAARVKDRAEAKLPAEEIMVVSITDGQENASHEYGLATIKQLIEAHTQAGWSFIFLGAALDVYGETRSLGYDDRSVQAWAADGTGADMAFHSLSASTKERRRLLRGGAVVDKGDFWASKPAEADREQRHGK